MILHINGMAEELSTGGMNYNMASISDFGYDDQINLKLLNRSIYVLHGMLEEDIALDAIKWLILQNGIKSDFPITIYINSLGGNLHNALALVDLIKLSKRTVRTIAIGGIHSAAFLVFVAGTRGSRYIGPNTSSMIHQYEHIIEGKHHELKASLKEGDNYNARMQSVLVSSSDLSPQGVGENLLRETNVFLTSQEMLDFGLADHILGENELTV